MPGIPTAPHASSGSSTPSTSVPTKPDGSPDFSKIPTNTSGGSVPVDSTGAIDIWSLPQFVLDYEKQTARPFFWDTTTVAGTPTNGNKAFNNERFRQANDLPADTGGKGKSFKEPVNVSAEQLMKQFTAMAFNDPASFLQFQQALAAGPWASNLKISGVFDQNTEQALATAMVQYLKTSRAAGVPISFKDYLLHSAASNSQDQVVPQPTLTNPETLKLAAQTAARQSLGHDLSEAQLNAFVDNFHTAETSSFNTHQASTGPAVDAGDPQSAAIAFVQQQDPTGFKQHSVTGFANALLNSMLSGGQPQLPTGSEVPTI